MDNNTSALMESWRAKPLSERYALTMTYESRRAYLPGIMDFFSVNSIDDIQISAIKSVTVNDTILFVDYLKSEGVAPATINKKMESLYNFYQFLCRENVGICTFNPFDTANGSLRVKEPKRLYAYGRSLDVSEVIRLIHSVDIPDLQNALNDGETALNRYKTALRDRLLLELLATTGCRRAELVSMKVGNIEYQNGRYTIEITGKGQKKRILVIPNVVKCHLDEYLEIRGVTYNDADVPVITVHMHCDKPNTIASTHLVYRVVKKYAEKAGLMSTEKAGSISPHTLRHSYCSNSLELGVEMKLVSECMGHSFLDTTVRYNHSRRIVTHSPNESLAVLYEL